MIKHALKELVATFVDWLEGGDLRSHLACWWAMASQYKLLGPENPVPVRVRSTAWQRLARKRQEEEG